MHSNAWKKKNHTYHEFSLKLGQILCLYLFLRFFDLWISHPKVLWYRKYLFPFQDSEHYIQLKKPHVVEIWLLKVAILPPLATPIHTPKTPSVFGGWEAGLVTKYLWHLKRLVWKPVTIVIVIMLKFMKTGATRFLLFRIEPNISEKWLNIHIKVA